MKCKLLFMLLFLSSYAFAQESSWIQYDIDKSVKVELPKVPNVFDTLGTKIFGSKSDDYVIVVTTIVNGEVVNWVIPNDEELQNFYNGIVRGNVKQLGGEILNKESINLGSLTALKYTMKAAVAGEVRLFFVTVLVVNYTVYSFQFIQPESQNDLLGFARQKFFDSIKITGAFQHKDQYNTDVE